MRLMCCELTMPGTNSWDGRWSGERNRYIKILRVSNKSKLTAGDYSYAFGDGWRASVEVTEITGEQSRKLRKISDGFCGYDWMVDEIRFYGRIRTNEERHPVKKAAIS